MTGWLRRLVPRRIASQIALLAVASVILAHAVITLAFFALGPGSGPPPPRDGISNIAFTANLLAETPDPAARAAILRSLETRLPGAELLAATANAYGSSDDPLAAVLQRQLGGGFEVTAVRANGPADQQVRLIVKLPDGATLSVPAPSVRHGGAGGVLIGTLVFLGSTLALLTFWAARALTAPLTRFADVAERFMGARPATPLPETGPREIVRAARALNDMQSRIQSMIEQRAQMLASISHDLRTPITRMRLRAEEIAQAPLRAEMMRDLDAMQQMIEAGLAFLRDQTAGTARERIDVRSIAQTVCDDFGDLGHVIAFDGALHLYADADPGQIARALANLIENALKFGTTVKVALTEANGRIVIDVEDDGPGIADAEKTKMLEPFYRGDEARTFNNQASFGLGLSITRAIVEAHGGTLELRDATPHGLLARITLLRSGIGPERDMI